MKPKMYRKKAVVIESMRFYADHLLMVEAAHWCYPCKPDIFEQTYEPVSARGGMSTVTARQLSADHLGRVVAVMGVSGRLAYMGAVLVGADRQITVALERDGRVRTLTVPTTAAVEVQS